MATLPEDVVVDVALAVLRRGDSVLLQQRDRAPFAGSWELPGGKVEVGESPAEAAVREAGEELGVLVREPRFLASHEHRYPGGPHLRLHAYTVTADVPLSDEAGLRWVPLEELASWDVLEGTRPLLAALQREGPSP